MTNQSLSDTIALFTNKPCVIETKQTLDEWVAAGKPQVVEAVSSYKGYILVEDSAFGRLFLLFEGRVVDAAKDFVKHGDIVGLSEYYVQPAGLFERKGPDNV